jgi:uncharacterized protein involved in exopolysaccharide biosynthesis|tara:strand:- start:2746 stop:3675 length:930 start_codon:yes stop_codon:yes gene_type:complete
MSAIEENMNNRVPEDEIDLRQLFSVIWKGKILVISITTLVALGSIFYALSLSNYFSSESVLVSRSSQDSSPLSQFSGLAAMGGIDLAGNSNNSTFTIMEIIQSREFVKHLITFENVLPSIIAAQHYDPGTQKLSFDPEMYDIKTKTWIREQSPNQSVEPTYLEVHRAYLEMLSIGQDRLTGFINIKIEHISPVFAKEFLELVIKEANNLNREIDIDKSSKALSYLKIELSQTSNFEMINSISRLIEGQLETRMMASIHEEYSLITLEPPFIPDKRSRPTRSLIVIFSTLIGGLIGIAWVLVRHFTSGKE